MRLWVYLLQINLLSGLHWFPTYRTPLCYSIFFAQKGTESLNQKNHYTLENICLLNTYCFFPKFSRISLLLSRMSNDNEPR